MNEHNTICCPECDYTNCLEEANFCGGCGMDLTKIKQQIHQQQFNQQQFNQQQFNQQQFNQQQFNQQQFNQQQFNQQQFNQHQFNQQQFNQQHYNQQYFNQYQPIPTKKKNKDNVWIIVLRFLLSISIVLCCSILIALEFVENGSKFENGIDESLFYNFINPKTEVQAEQYYFAGGISSEEYSKLKNGMSYALASSIIGGDGVLVNSGENLQNQFYYTYSWVSEIDENTVYFITFVDDSISEIIVDTY